MARTMAAVKPGLDCGHARLDAATLTRPLTRHPTSYIIRVLRVVRKH